MLGLLLTTHKWAGEMSYATSCLDMFFEVGACQDF